MRLGTFVIGSSLLLASGVAFAHGHRGPGPGGPGGDGSGPMAGCAGILLHAPEPMLEAKLSLDAAQLDRLRAIRRHIWIKGTELENQLRTERAKMRVLWQDDLPDEAKVVAQSRRSRAARGRLAEERLKAHLHALAVLTKAQREQLRATCGPPRFGKHHGDRGPHRGPGPGACGGGEGDRRGPGPAR